MHNQKVKDLSLKDILSVLAFPYIMISYAILCLIYAPIEWFKEKLERWRTG